MSDALLTSLRDLIQRDPGVRGLATIPGDNLLTACPDDFADACHNLAQSPRAKLLIVTGFYIADAQPPCGETDGPLGALFLARALQPLGVEVTLATDAFCISALRAGLEECRLQDHVGLVKLPNVPQAFKDNVTHLLAIERVGPSHTANSVQARAKNKAETLALFEAEVHPDQRDRCYTMSGRDVTPYTSPAHLLFEEARSLVNGHYSIAGDGHSAILDDATRPIHSHDIGMDYQ